MQQFVEYPQLRRCPPHVLAGLRAIEPTADLLYFGRGRWLLGYTKYDQRLVAEGEQILKRALWLEEISRHNPRFTINPAHKRRIAGRLELALLVIQGWRYVAEFQRQGSPDSSIVNDFQQADWMFRNTSDADFFAMLDQPHDERVAAARAELTDPARGRSAWSWMSNLSIGPASVQGAGPPRSNAKTLVHTI